MYVQKINRNVNNSFSDGSHVMLRLIYVSRAFEGIQASDMEAILASAQKKNKENGITGMLVFNRSFFLQVIEGPRPVINDLLKSLISDTRHFHLVVISCEEIDERKWENWSMDYVIPSAANQNTFLKYSSKSGFDPYLMTSQRVIKLLDALTDNKKPSAKPEPELKAPQKKKSTFLSFKREKA